MNFIKIIQNKWNDPVWSKVIATIIISILGFVLTTLYSIINKIPFIKIWTLFDNVLTVKIWVFFLLISLYVIIIFKPIVDFIRNITLKNIKQKKQLPPASEHSTTFFSQRIASAFPGIRGIVWYDNPKEATKRLEILLRPPLKFKNTHREFNSTPIWWFRGNSSLHILKGLKK